MPKKLKICPKGHRFYQSSDCPVCEREMKPVHGFLSGISAPAKRALESNGITSLQKLAKYSKEEILMLHGIGPSTIPKLKEALSQQKLSFKL